MEERSSATAEVMFAVDPRSELFLFRGISFRKYLILLLPEF